MKISVLEFHRGGGLQFRVRLSRSETLVGRGARCDVTLTEEHVSRVHFGVRRTGEGYSLVDRSRNGTLLNGRPVDRADLEPGDVIALEPWEIRFASRTDGDPPVTVVRDLLSPVPVVATSPASGRVTVESGELLVREGVAAGERYVIRKPEVHVGSDPGCDWVLPGDVAPVHFSVRLDCGAYLLRDRGSGEGTQVDGVAVAEEVPLVSGAKVRAGGALLELRTGSREEPVRAHDGDRFGEMLGGTEVMRRLFGTIRRTATSDVPVLVLGETGTGKELVARALHDHGRYPGGPFVAVNCGAISRDLVESELFGHVSGAFTGATANRTGAFREAHGGTLFLDEIGDLALESQVRFLRTLETGYVRPVGADRDLSVDVRIVAATHRNLAQEVQEGRFREDLFFRLNVMALLVPPLRERREDIPLLARHFLDTVVERPIQISGQAMDKLVAHPWRGNVRALRNCLLRATLLCDGDALEPRDIQFDAVHAAGPDPLMGLRQEEVAGLLEDAERTAVVKALDACGGNKMAAARMLGIAKSTLHTKLKKYGMM